MSLRDLALSNLDKPQWAEFAKRYQTPEPASPNEPTSTPQQERTIFSAPNKPGK